MLGATGVQDVRTPVRVRAVGGDVEFAWGTDIRTARQTVQERLATVAGDMPEGVRPQMAPVSSIMGQFLIAGMRRQTGAEGRRACVRLPDTPLLRRAGAEAGRPARPVRVEGDSTARTRAAWEAVPVAGAKWDEPTADGDQRVRATIAGQSRDFVFPSEAKRQLALRTLADWVVRPAAAEDVRASPQVIIDGRRAEAVPGAGRPGRRCRSTASRFRRSRRRCGRTT